MKPHLYIPPSSTLTSHNPSTSTTTNTNTSFTTNTTNTTTTTIYEPSEDSFLLIDAISSSSEREFLHSRFSLGKQGRATQVSAAPAIPTPFVFEVGVGSGVVLGHVSAYAEWILGRGDVLCAGGDVNRGAVRVGGWNVGVAGRERGWKAEMAGNLAGEKSEVSGGATGLGNSEEREREEADSTADKTTTSVSISTACTSRKTNSHIPANGQALFLDILHSSLLSALAPRNVDILLFNPPYVPTETLPSPITQLNAGQSTTTAQSNFETESHLYALAYAGGHDGMEVTNQLLAQLDECLSDTGVAYVLFCARNRPEEVRRRLVGEGWGVVIAGESGGKGGWERLCVLRVFRKVEGEG